MQFTTFWFAVSGFLKVMTQHRQQASPEAASSFLFSPPASRWDCPILRLQPFALAIMRLPNVLFITDNNQEEGFFLLSLMECAYLESWNKWIKHTSLRTKDLDHCSFRIASSPLCKRRGRRMKADMYSGTNVSATWTRKLSLRAVETIS